jgi:kinesin family protein 22
MGVVGFSEDGDGDGENVKNVKKNGSGGGMVIQQVGHGGGGDPEVGMKPTGSWGHRYGQKHKLGSIAETTEFGQELTNAAVRGDSMPGSFPKVAKRSFGDVEGLDEDGSSHRSEARVPVKKVKLEEGSDGDGDDDGMTSEDEVEGQVWKELTSAPMAT